MAINGCELKVIEFLIKKLNSRLKRRPKILFLGYPDVLATEKTFSNLNLSVDWLSISKRKDSKEVWRGHGRDHGDYPMCESKALINAFGADCVVLDAIRWGGEDFVVDLNLPLSAELTNQLGVFDLIVDPGTVEHCFNIAQAFINITNLIAPSGFVYHQAAVAFPNHGFWSLSPTAFFDFYESRNFVLGTPYIWIGTCDQEGFEPRFNAIDPFAALVGFSTPLIGSFVFQSSSSGAFLQDAGFPIQRCYSGKFKTLPLSDFCGTALPESHRLPGNQKNSFAGHNAVLRVRRSLYTYLVRSLRGHGRLEQQ